MARKKTPVEIKVIEVEDDSPAVLDAWVQATETLMRIRQRLTAKKAQVGPMMVGNEAEAKAA